MIVSGLDKDGDWRFGKGKAVYIRNSEAIRQNVVTRLKSFQDDWFLDVDNGLPWIEMLGSKNTEKRILAEVEKCVLETEGVRIITRLRINKISDRTAEIELSFVDIFNTEYSERIAP